MKFYGIDVQSYIKLKEYEDSEPVYSSATDGRRFIYVNDTINGEDSLYLGGEQEGGWVRILTSQYQGEITGSYTSVESDAKYIQSSVSDSRDFDVWGVGIVYDDVHGEWVNPNATFAKIAETGGVYDNATGADHVVKRNGSGDIYANTGYLTATSAEYADLAEKYTCDLELPEGTVVGVSNDSEYEVCPYEEHMNGCIGVVSTKPAYLMNSKSNGLPITLTGKIPINIVGPITKGDFLVPCASGLARRGKDVSVIDLGNKFAIALESNPQLGEHLVMCIKK